MLPTFLVGVPIKSIANADIGRLPCATAPDYSHSSIHLITRLYPLATELCTELPEYLFIIGVSLKMANTKPSAKTVDTSASALQSSLNTLVQNYRATTLTRTKLIDCFLLVLVASGVLQFAYRILITGYPLNAFFGR